MDIKKTQLDDSLGIYTTEIWGRHTIHGSHGVSGHFLVRFHHQRLRPLQPMARCLAAVESRDGTEAVAE